MIVSDTFRCVSTATETSNDRFAAPRMSPVDANVPRQLQNNIFVDDDNGDSGDPVCVERIPFVERDDPNGHSFIDFFEPLTIACPGVGKRVMATFSYCLHVEPDSNDHSMPWFLLLFHTIMK